ncbi:MAG: DUF4386 domain-containing protein [Sphingobacteriales bacterium]|nr:MAG: DUF4386 domain-containing protein [Sphingobacteriales bacterium]
MNANKRTAHIAGIIYLVVVLTGIFSLAYAPSRLIFWDNPAETLLRIRNSEGLFRLSIISSIICYIAFLLLPLVLYRLLSPVNSTYAKLMVVFALVSVPISFLNLQNKYDVLTLVSKVDYVKEFTEQQIRTNVMLLLERYDHGILILQIFWGLWLFPFGYLVFKSGILPKVLGILLMLGCIGYLISVIGHTASKSYGELAISKYIRLPASIGEIGTCLWLLIMGAKKSQDKQ